MNFCDSGLEISHPCMMHVSKVKTSVSLYWRKYTYFRSSDFFPKRKYQCREIT